MDKRLYLLIPLILFCCKTTNNETKKVPRILILGDSLVSQCINQVEKYTNHFTADVYSYPGYDPHAIYTSIIQSNLSGYSHAFILMGVNAIVTSPGINIVFTHKTIKHLLSVTDNITGITIPDWSDYPYATHTGLLNTRIFNTWLQRHKDLSSVIPLASIFKELRAKHPIQTDGLHFTRYTTDVLLRCILCTVEGKPNEP